MNGTQSYHAPKQGKKRSTSSMNINVKKRNCDAYLVCLLLILHRKKQCGLDFHGKYARILPYTGSMLISTVPRVIFNVQISTALITFEVPHFPRWICDSDSECSKALEYYHLYCRGMFRGRVCTSRCKNSISILRRQTQAKKLEECR